MIVWGGYDDSDSGSGGRYSPLIDTWAPTGTGAGVPSPRSYHTGIWTGSEMIVWGGSNETGYVVDGSRYCPCATLGNYYRDADGDGYGDPATEVTICDVGGPPVGYAANNADCNDGESHIYSGAPEINDGIDNQCPGNPGFGLRDELAGVFGFLTAGDKTKLSWPAQSGATGYTVARSPYRDFHAGCRLIPTDVSNWSDLELPGPGTVYYYLVRAANPAAGTWGARSSGVERTVCNGCGSAIDGFAVNRHRTRCR